MLKIFRIAPILSIIVFSIVFLANSGGSPGRRTGSPSDGSSCGTNGGCHGPKTPENIQLLISTIPGSGYIPGEDYEITIAASKTNINRYGFELVAEDASGVAKGVFKSNNDVNATNNRATHKFQSISGTGGKTWTVTWTAPSQGSGDVSFYVAVLAANGNGTTSGDNVLLDNFSVTEGKMATATFISEVDVSVYPNPASNYLFVSGINETVKRVRIIDSQGKTFKINISLPKIDISELAAGTYFVVVESGDWVIRKSFIKR